MKANITHNFFCLTAKEFTTMYYNYGNSPSIRYDLKVNRINIKFPPLKQSANIRRRIPKHRLKSVAQIFSSLALISTPPFTAAHAAQPLTPIHETVQGPAGSFSVSITPPDNPTGPIVSLNDPDVRDAAEDDLSLIQRGIDKAIRLHAQTLSFPPRVYNIYSPPGDAPWSLINIAKANDLTLEGNGSTIIFHGLPKRCGLQVANSSRVALTNFKIFWNDRFVFPARYEQQLGQKYIEIDSRFALDPSHPPKITQIFQYDVSGMRLQKTHEPFLGLMFNCNGASAFCPQFIGNNRYVLPDMPGQPSPANDAPVLATERNNNLSAILITQNSNNISLIGISLYNSPGSGIAVVNAGSGFLLDHVTIGLRPEGDPSGEGLPQFLSTTSDGIDFIATDGEIIVQGGNFSFEGDDGINIHGRIANISSDDLATNRILLPTDYGNSYRVGDPIDVLDSNNFEKVASGYVSNANFIGGIMNLSVSIQWLRHTPKSYPLLLVNERQGSENFIVRNNTFYEIKNRGIIVRGENGLISSNEISETSSSGIQIAMEAGENQPIEGPVPKNILAMNNHLSNTNDTDFYPSSNRQKYPAAILLYLIQNNEILKNHLISDIGIVNNYIGESPGEAIAVFSGGDNILISGNRIENINSYRFSWPLDHKADVYVGH